MNDIFAAVFIAICVGVTCYAIGWVTGENHAQKEAISAGVAEWTIDPVTGERTFQFKKTKP